MSIGNSYKMFDDGLSFMRKKIEAKEALLESINNQLTQFAEQVKSQKNEKPYLILNNLSYLKKKSKDGLIRILRQGYEREGVLQPIFLCKTNDRYVTIQHIAMLCLQFHSQEEAKTVWIFDNRVPDNITGEDRAEILTLDELQSEKRCASTTF